MMLIPVVLHLKIRKGSEKDPSSMASALGSISEIFRSKPEVISWEIVCKGGFIHFFVVSEKSVSEIIRGQLFAQYPELEVEEIADYTYSLSSNTVTSTVSLKYSDVYPLKTYKDIGSDFLTSLSGISSSLSDNETIILQIVTSPINKESFLYKLSYSFGFKQREKWRSNITNAELWRDSEQEKHYLPLFKTAIHVTVDAGSKSTLLASSATSLLKKLDNPDLNSFKIESPKTNSHLDLIQKRFFGGKSFTFSNNEIATLFHLSSKEGSISQVSTTNTKTVEPPLNLPTPPSVIPFASTNYRGTHTEFGIKREDRRKHLYVIGKTGVGKTKLLELLALSDIREKKGALLWIRMVILQRKFYDLFHGKDYMTLFILIRLTLNFR